MPGSEFPDSDLSHGGGPARDAVDLAQQDRHAAGIGVVGGGDVHLVLVAVRPDRALGVADVDGLHAPSVGLPSARNNPTFVG